ncbi:restriction endonuclease subunit S [Loigolactobacillus backii]|uniref:restriction endonuclease subunit S n=1 Tax=Loigolactobacillus backii TaxID=375175 RepID=UPI0007F1262A|nr:restriction endonuclease subunit S [Loigolactobacillus backii]ANK61141.1 type I restriction endonuclease [Loigolactobacillus backii]
MAKIDDSVKKKVPELRFPGFTDDWEDRKLGDLSQDTIGGGTPKTSVTEYWNGEIPWIQSSNLANDKLYGVLPKKFITEDAVKNSATKLIPANSIAIVTRVGVGKLAFMPYEFASSQDFLSLSNLQVDCNFGMYSIYKMLQRELNNIQGTSIKGITKADLLDKETFVPIKVEEQQKIGSFFKQLDDTVVLHQRKLDLLKEQKKGYLQKMFPKNGAKVPELRFAGFADAWEQRKLGDIFSERNERANSGQYKMLSITVDSGIVPADSLDRKDNSSSDKSHYKRVFEGDIAYNSMRMWQGASGVSEMNGIVSPAYTVLKPSKQTDTKFISYLFKLTPMLQSFQKNSQGLTSDTWNLKYKQFSPIKVKIPILNEQMKIGKVLEMLDDSIDANQRKLEKLQELKKVYLQKMFV